MTDDTNSDTTLEQLFAIADGTIAETQTALVTTEDPEQVAQLVLAEVTSRAQFFAGPSIPVVVQLDLGVADKRLGYQVVVGDGSVTVLPGWADDPHVRVRQDLAELLLAVYGPPGRPHDASREVVIDDSGKPEVFRADDPWMVRWNASVLAAGQIVRACSPYRADLTDLALRFGSDKWGGHWYTPHYDRHFAPYRDQRVKVLEIGIGGYRQPDVGGASLRMWRHYFSRGLVYGLDIFDKSPLDEQRVRTIIGDQSDTAFLIDLYEHIGPLDIIIDDGSHLSDYVIASFVTLFPRLRPGGLYVIEDLQTSYWSGYNGNRTGLDDPGTSVGFLKTLIDGLHHQDQVRAEPHEPSDIEVGVTAIHLYHNMVFIEKGVNTEQTAPAWLPRSAHTNG